MSGKGSGQASQRSEPLFCALLCPEIVEGSDVFSCEIDGSVKTLGAFKELGKKTRLGRRGRSNIMEAFEC